MGDSRLLPQRPYFIDERNSQFSPHPQSGGTVKHRGMSVQQVRFFRLDDRLDALGEGAGTAPGHEEWEKSIRHRERPIVTPYPFYSFRLPPITLVTLIRCRKGKHDRLPPPLQLGLKNTTAAKTISAVQANAVLYDV
jgi:hypothetical protein